ncbi:MAG: PqqD family protein [Acidobacteria bacterium]|nr:PqqD family protein [Acidobacteriota bacterium]
MKRFLETETDDGLLLYDPDTDHVHSLNATGLYIFRKHAEGKTEDEIVEEILSGFSSTDPDGIRRDVHAFLSNLREKDLA